MYAPAVQGRLVVGGIVGWINEEFGKSHEGYIGALLADGTEPDPQYIDVGSGSFVPKTSEWWAYDGNLRRPEAARVRAACSCGWRGPDYPLDWAEAEAHGSRYEPDCGVCGDWEEHIATVGRRTVAVPEEVAVAVNQLRTRLLALAEDTPAAAMRVVATLESLIQEAGRTAAAPLYGEKQWEQLSAALGVSTEEARSRVTHYLLP